MPTVSVIIPVYNSEQYLEQCLNSVFSQNFTDFEVILVDDGSTDRSEQIYRGFESDDCRLKVIKSSNQGAAHARNIGLENAIGEYVMFCDSDDLVSPNWISRLIRFMNSDHDVYPVGAYCSSPEQLGTLKDTAVQAEVLLDMSEFLEFFISDVAGYLWNGIFVREIILDNKLHFHSRFEEADYNEDLNFVLSYVQSIHKVVYTGYSDYCYLERIGSLSKTGANLHFAKYLEKYRVWKEFILNNELSDPDTRIHLLAKYILPSLMSGLQSTIIHTPSKHILTCFRDLREMVCDGDLSDCIENADNSVENPRIIQLIRKQALLRLISYLKLYKWKQRLKNENHLHDSR